MMSQTGHPETGPTRTGFMQVDMSTGIYTAFTIASSLHRRATTGLGQYIDVAMMDTAVLLQATQFNNYLVQGTLDGLIGNNSQTGIPTANVFPTKDGYLQITALQKAQVEKLFEVLEISEALEQPEFSTTESRIKNPKLVFELIRKVLAANSARHWKTLLAAEGIPVALVRTVPDVAGDPQFDTREIFETMPSPVGVDQTITVVKAAFKSNEDGPVVHQAAPHLGEHTTEILTELGYSAKDIQSLRDNKII